MFFWKKQRPEPPSPGQSADWRRPISRRDGWTVRQVFFLVFSLNKKFLHLDLQMRHFFIHISVLHICYIAKTSNSDREKLRKCTKVWGVCGTRFLLFACICLKELCLIIQMVRAMSFSAIWNWPVLNGSCTQQWIRSLFRVQCCVSLQTWKHKQWR